MQAIANEAGVGKGTVFRRFGDRSRLMLALLDEPAHDLEELLLHGPPPLGPGAAAPERLEAFLVAFVRAQLEHDELALAATQAAPDEFPPAYDAFLVHVQALIGEIDPALDAEALAGYLISAISPGALRRRRSTGMIDSLKLERAVIQLARGVSRTGELAAG